MDTLARALLSAAEVVEAGELEKVRAERYAGWDTELGRRIEAGEMSLAGLAEYATENQLDPKPRSGRQELVESIVARHCKP